MIVARDLPYILGFFAIAALGLWSVGRLADRGKLAGSGEPFMGLLYFVLFGAMAVVGIVNHDWVKVGITGTFALLGIVLAVRGWRRGAR